MSSDSLAVLVPEIQENQLVLPESTDGLTLAHYLPVLQQYREVNASMVFDCRDKKGNAAARSHVAKLRRIKAPITEIHKRLKAEYLAITQQMDADKRDALAVVEEMIEHHDKELRVVASEEAAKAMRIEAEKMVCESWDLAHQMNDIFDQQRELAKQAAEQARIAEEQAAEQQRLKVEAEKKEAADKAAEEARLAEKARAAHAIEEAKQREQAAKDEAERKVKEVEARAALEKKEAEMRVAREKAEAEAIVKADADRNRQEEEQAKADLENIKRVHWAIIPSLVTLGITENQAKKLILAIRSGEVPALSINYQWQPIAESESGQQ